MGRRRHRGSRGDSGGDLCSILEGEAVRANNARVLPDLTSQQTPQDAKDVQHPSREDQAKSLVAAALKGWRTRQHGLQQERPRLLLNAWT